ncbi:two-component system cell cycle sensor histidine kinase PleC [Azospirillum brasilense]|uniref:histidine kinase n=1 Tax=Azospirillum brasilense TaxID=192 RepID=A0A560CP24_AZOBR|nr:two-component system cell cycle sensor histidine kinase PleC [Azospirillum brasilense]
MDAVIETPFRDRQPEAATPAGADSAVLLDGGDPDGNGSANRAQGNDARGDDALLGAAMAALADGIGVLAAVRDDTGAIRDFEWLTANRAAERLFGHPLAGRRLRADDLQDGEGAGLFAGLTDCLTEKQTVRRLVIAPGGARWRIAATPLDPASVGSGRAAPTVCVSLVELGAEVPVVPESHRAHRAKAEFLAHMSHELRTPLNAVLGFSEVLLAETFGPLGSPRYRSYAADIHASGTHLLSLIDGILDLSQSETARTDMQEEAINVADAARQALAQMGDKAAARGVDIGEDLSAELPLLYGDARALQRMLTNLLSNAVKFTPSGGQVMVSASPMPDGGIGLMVADTGAGIAEDELARVLEPFGRADMAVPRGAAGAGIGLPVVKRLMEMHGGRLDLYSEPGAGTTAILMFPPRRSLPHTHTGARA